MASPAENFFRFLGMTGTADRIRGPESELDALRRENIQSQIEQRQFQLGELRAGRERDRQFRESLQNPVVLGALSQQTGVPEDVLATARSLSDISTLRSLTNPSGGTVMANVQRVMQDNPGMNFTQALQLYQTGFRQNMQFDPTTGSIVPIQGAPESLGVLAQAENYGGELGTLQAQEQLKPIIEEKTTQARQNVMAETEPGIRADIAESEMEARGEVSPKEKRRGAKKRVTGNLTKIASAYNRLADMGGVVDTEQSTAANLAASLSASGPGQYLGRITGSQAQAVRDEINQIRPTLVNDIRQAAEMGAKGMDSEKELEFFLQAATDPRRAISTNMAALKVLNDAYGLGEDIDAPEQRINDLRREFRNLTDGNRTEFSSVQEAEAANLPPGTRITINGRPAIVE